MIQAVVRTWRLVHRTMRFEGHEGKEVSGVP